MQSARSRARGSPITNSQWESTWRRGGRGGRPAATMKGSRKAEVAARKRAPKINSPICCLGLHRVPQGEGAGCPARALGGVRAAAVPQLRGCRHLPAGRLWAPRPDALPPGEIGLEPRARQAVSSGSQLQDEQREAAPPLPGAPGSC